MKWIDILNQWSNGEYPFYPKRFQGGKDKFLWNTSVLKNNGNTIFKEKYKINKELPVRQNYKAFKEHIQKSKHKYVTSFPNLNGDTILVVPMPRAGKSYATFKDFVDNAPKIQQQEFWKKVATIAEKQMKKFGSVWVSAHGLGVPYLHIRVCSMPKYYFDKDLAKKTYTTSKKLKGGNKQIGGDTYYVVEFEVNNDINIPNKKKTMKSFFDSRNRKKTIITKVYGNKYKNRPLAKKRKGQDFSNREQRTMELKQNLQKGSKFYNMGHRFYSYPYNNLPCKKNHQKYIRLVKPEKLIKDIIAHPNEYIFSDSSLSFYKELNPKINFENYNNLENYETETEIIQFLVTLDPKYVEYYLCFFNEILSPELDRYTLLVKSKKEFIQLLIDKHDSNENSPSDGSSTGGNSSTGSTGSYTVGPNGDGIKKFNGIKFNINSTKYTDDEYASIKFSMHKIIKELRMFYIKKNDFLVEYKSWYLKLEEPIWDESYCNLCIKMENGIPIFDTNMKIIDTNTTKITVLYEIIGSVDYLHKQNFVHMDLKPHNCVKVGDNYKLIDFDTTLSLDDKYNNELNKAGTPVYMNWRVHNLNSKLTRDELIKYDIYSIGIMIWVIFFSNKNPWSNGSTHNTKINVGATLKLMKNLKKSIINGKKVIVNGKITNTNTLTTDNQLISKLIMECIGKLEERPTIQEILEELQKLKNQKN